MRHICYTLVTLSLSTLATLLLHNIGNQKCATFTTLFPNYLSTIHKACPKPLFSFCSSGHPLQLLSQGPLLLKDPKRGSGSTPSVMEGMARCLSGSWGSS